MCKNIAVLENLPRNIVNGLQDLAIYSQLAHEGLLSHHVIPIFKYLFIINLINKEQTVRQRLYRALNLRFKLRLNDHINNALDLLNLFLLLQKSRDGLKVSNDRVFPELEVQPFSHRPQPFKKNNFFFHFYKKY